MINNEPLISYHPITLSDIVHYIIYIAGRTMRVNALGISCSLESAQWGFTNLIESPPPPTCTDHHSAFPQHWGLLYTTVCAVLCWLLEQHLVAEMCRVDVVSKTT